MKDADIHDDVWLSQYRVCPHEQKLYRKLTQPTRNLILNRNAELRKCPGAVKDMGFARQSLSIPVEDYEMLKKKYPVLVNGSNAERTKFYKKFIKSSESLIYRVQ